MLQVALDRSGFEEVIKSITDLSYNNKTYAFKTGTMFRDRQSRLSVHDLLGLMELMKEQNPDLYSFLEKSIASSLITQVAKTDQNPVIIRGIPKKKAEAISVIHQAFADLKLSGLEKDWLTKAKNAGIDIVAANEELRSAKYLFDSKLISLKKGKKMTWKEVFTSCRHKTRFLKLVDPYALNQKDSMINFVSGLVSHSRDQLDFTLITKEEEFKIDTKEIERLFAEQGYSITFKTVLFRSSASTEIHDRQVLTDKMFATLGSGVDNINRGKVYRNGNIHITGKYYEGGADYRKVVQTFTELESGGIRNN
ncbi:MAG: hypothetical protein LAT67_08725 [Balneolales bacterium]|nr:hypothetical protein [Balneolales bacterium]